MTTTTAPVPSIEVSSGASRPSALRRVAVAAAALVSCALPVTFTVTISAMLVTGADVDHRFHQLTGKGLVLLALWLGSVLPLIRAGWRGRRPSTAVGYRHLAFIGAGVVTSAIAAGGGARVLVAVVAVTGALLWAAIPLRPRLGGTISVDPVLTPLALFVGAVLMPYAADQLAPAATSSRVADGRTCSRQCGRSPPEAPCSARRSRTGWARGSADWRLSPDGNCSHS
ncbi:hypothetical protein GCM10023168_28540 [Fodinibacter luteus]|uniref:Uncharacterized protein n=1 Tax=Fodinibacter luteus TaxID=552064 RepID=A0ABP8KMD0_9MICO